MAKKTTGNWGGRFKTAFVSFAANNWQWSLGMAATIYQIIEQTLEWPVFFLVLLTIIALSFWLANQFRIWLWNRTLKNKLTVAVNYVLQTPDIDNGEKCQYQLYFQMVNVHDRPIYCRVEEMKWDLKNSSATASDIQETKQQFAPGPIELKTPTIGGLEPNHFYNGRFKLKFRLGFEFEKEKMELEVRGSFELKNRTEIPEPAKLGVTSKITKYEYTRL